MMAITTAYTLTEAQEMLDAWKACEKALASGQAKEYRVGSRNLHRWIYQISQPGLTISAMWWKH